jgi:hypothetical protein
VEGKALAYFSQQGEGGVGELIATTPNKCGFVKTYSRSKYYELKAKCTYL